MNSLNSEEALTILPFENFFSDISHSFFSQKGRYSQYLCPKKLGTGYIDKLVWDDVMEIEIQNIILSSPFQLSKQSTFSSFDIHYVWSGSIDYTLSRTSLISVEAGNLIITSPLNTVKQVAIPSGTPIHALSIKCSSMFVSESFSVNLTNMTQTNFSRPIQPSVSEEKLLETFKASKISTKTNHYLYPCSAISLLTLLLEPYFSVQTTLSQSCQSYEDAALEKTRKLIEQNMMQPLTLKTLSQKAGMSESSFRISFSKKYKMPPRQYLISCRMKEALNLLKNKNYSVTEASYKVGYTNVSYFSRKFREYYGFSPKHARFI